MPNLAQCLIEEERGLGGDSNRGSRASFRVFHKLRQPLSNFLGPAGVRSLFPRALVLAKVQAPSRKGVQIKADGKPEYSREFEAQLNPEDAVRAGAALVSQSLGLLTGFIGEALTLRLLHEVWPKAAVKDPNSGGEIA